MKISFVQLRQLLLGYIRLFYFPFLRAFPVTCVNNVGVLSLTLVFVLLELLLSLNLLLAEAKV